MITSRQMQAGDEELTFAWRQDAATVAAAVDQTPTTLTTHRVWFLTRLSEPDRVVHIVEQDGVPIGMFTATLRKEHAELGYLVAPEYRGRGLAKEIRRMGIERIGAWRPDLRLLRSDIRKENVRSLRTALRGGARVVGETPDGFVHLETDLVLVETAAA
jgi:RimJ/RimL family protein N-acetyltransferase